MGKCYYRVRSTRERGHWRDGRWWPPSWVDVEELNAAIMTDTRFEVEVIGEVMQPVIDSVSKRVRGGGKRGRKG